MAEVERQWRDFAHYRAHYYQDLHRDIQHAILPDDDTGDRWQGAARQWMEKKRS